METLTCGVVSVQSWRHVHKNLSCLSKLQAQQLLAALYNEARMVAKRRSEILSQRCHWSRSTHHWQRRKTHQALQAKQGYGDPIESYQQIIAFKLNFDVGPSGGGPRLSFGHSAILSAMLSAFSAHSLATPLHQIPCFRSLILVGRPLFRQKVFRR